MISINGAFLSSYNSFHRNVESNFEKRQSYETYAINVLNSTDVNVSIPYVYRVYYTHNLVLDSI